MKSDGSFGQSAPCAECTKFLKNKGFKKVNYTDESGEFVHVNIREYETNHKSHAQKKCNIK